MSGWRSLFLAIVSVVYASLSILATGAHGHALTIAWAIFLTGAMICGAIEERGER